TSQPTGPSGPIFVIGCPRSGTTLLTLMLSSHSRIAIPPETRFLLPVFRRRRSFGDLTNTGNRRRLARALVRRQGTKFRHLGLDPERVKKAVIQSPPTVGSAIGAVYRTYAASQGKPRWGDKRPTYYRNVDVLRRLFPDAQFVHLVRDGRDCVASLKRMRWWRQGTAGAVATWVHSVDCARRAGRALPSGSFHELRYEDLVAEPRRQLEGLCAFLGEEFEETMLAPQGQADLLPKRQRQVWHSGTLEAVSPSRVGTYVGVLAPAEVALVERVAGSRLQRLGYEIPPTAGSERADPADVGRCARALTTMRAKTRVLALRDRWLARPHHSVADRG
ncbi:MAG: sulfotransferase family protein, partial [Actinomycetes bacterium]